MRYVPAILSGAVLSISLIEVQGAAEETKQSTSREIIHEETARASDGKQRVDGAEELPIAAEGSLQNAAWSPNGAAIIFTRFRGGYNKGRADILVFDFATRSVRTLIGGNDTNVSQPGSTWNAHTDRVVFSSTRAGHDEIFMIGGRGRSDTLKQLTYHEKYMAYEPSMSPDGRSVVFEAHPIDQETNGVIKRLTVDSLQVEELTAPDEDCRQPNWSPAGDTIVYQKKADGRWNLWVYDIPTKTHRRLTDGEGDKTDATFSPDGRWVVYSADNATLRRAALFAINLASGRKIQITDAGVYDGAPSWSPDGKFIAFESTAGEEIKPGFLGWLRRLWARLFKLVQLEPPTRLWKIKVPEQILRDLCLAGPTCPRGG